MSNTASAINSDEINIPIRGNHKKEDRCSRLKTPEEIKFPPNITTPINSDEIRFSLEGVPLDGNHQKEASKCRICLTEDISHFIFPCGCFILCQHCAGPEQLLRYP